MIQSFAKALILSFCLPILCLAQSVGSDISHFAFRLNKELHDEQENLLFSPYGIFSNLALLSFGAEGSTAEQIQQAISLSGIKEPFFKRFHNYLTGLTTPHKSGYQLDLANGLFIHQKSSFLQDFKDIASCVFDAKLQAIDYANPSKAVETINQWVSQKTRGKVPSLVEEKDLNQSTRLVVANALYFDGDWVHPFEKSKTKILPFYPENGEDLQVSMLSQMQSLPYFENSQVQCVSLSFVRADTKQPQLECVLILPKKGSLYSYEASASTDSFQELISQMEPTWIDLKVPKFCLTKRVELNQPLQALGMKIPFTYQADFSKLDGMKDLFLNTVLHETFFAFHERGVTAASATASSVGIKAAPPQDQEAIPFIADHPFAFYLIDSHTKAILFMGHLMQPKACGDYDR